MYAINTRRYPTINCIRFADDMITSGEKTRTLLRLLTVLEEKIKKYEMTMNVVKTKLMEVNIKEGVGIGIRERIIEKVESI